MKATEMAKIAVEAIVAGLTTQDHANHGIEQIDLDSAIVHVSVKSTDGTKIRTYEIKVTLLEEN